jgi:hypothetical protein
MLGGIIHAFVDAQDNRNVFVLRRSRDDYLLDRSADMLLGIIGIGEMASRFDHNLRAD